MEIESANAGAPLAGGQWEIVFEIGVVIENVAGIDASTKPRQCGRMLLTAVLMPAEEGGFIALNPETGTTTQGETVAEAVDNLREATALFLEEFPAKSSGHPVVTTFELANHA